MKSVFVSAILAILVSSISLAKADCAATCAAVEATAQVACVAAIFDEPECSIGVAAAYAACKSGCASRRHLLAESESGVDHQVVGKHIVENMCDQTKMRRLSKAAVYCEDNYRKALGMA